MLRLITRAPAHRHIIPLSSRQRYNHTSARLSDPLRILFCGSDGFSCESLRALHREYVRDKGLVEALDVMVLPARKMGRGFKMVREGEWFSLPFVTRLFWSWVVSLWSVDLELLCFCRFWIGVTELVFQDTTYRKHCNFVNTEMLTSQSPAKR